MAGFNEFITWVYGDPLRAAQLNEQVRDNGAELAKGAVAFQFDGGGAVLGVGDELCIPSMPFKSKVTAGVLRTPDGTIGDVSIDFRVPTVASDQPTSDDSIGALTMACDSYSRDATLSGWTVGIGANLPVHAVVLSVTTLEKVTAELEITRAS